MDASIKGKRVLVTGGAGCIARTLVKLLVENGAKVIALDIRGDELQKLYGGQKEVTPVVCDLADWDETKATVAKHLPIDLLVNNAGVVKMGPFLSCDEKAVDWHLNINFKPMISVSQVVANDLIDRKVKGSIVNLASVCSSGGYGNASIYSATKAAVASITESMAVELATHGIRVNSVRPGPCNGPTIQVYHDFDARVEDYIKLRTPTHQYTEPEEIASAIFFLLSDKASAITGVNLPTDHGFTANPL